MQTFNYQPIDRAWKTKFLTSQADALCLAVRNAVGLGKQFALSSFDIQNNSGGSISCGLAGRLPVALWKAGQCNATNVFVDDTTDAQADVSNGFLLGTDGTVNTGIMVLSRVPFNVISVVTTTVATGGTTFDIAYSTGTSTWTAITGSLVAPDWTPSAGEQLVHFPMPGADWVPCVVGHGADIPLDAPGWYGIRIRETAGNTAAGKARVLVLGVSRYALAGLATGNVESVMRGLGEISLPPQCDGLAAVLSAANDGNLARCNYRLRG